MATTTYRNVVDLSGILSRELPVKIAQIHKATAKQYAAQEGFTDKAEVFAVRARNRPMKYSSIDAIPDKALLMPATIGLVSKTGENFAVEIATEFAAMFMRLSAPKPRTGAYRDSLRFLLNDRMRAISTMQKIQEFNPLSDKEIVTIFSAVPYASTLEAPNYNVDGVFLKIVNALIQKWGAKASIRFAYTSGMKVSQGFRYATPIVLISGRGTFATTTVTRRGYQMRKRKRAAAKIKREAFIGPRKPRGRR